MRTGIIGAGKVGCSLGKYFRLNNLKITGYYDVNENLAKEAATFTETTFIEDLETIVKISDTLFLTVPDASHRLLLQNTHVIALCKNCIYR